MVNVGLTNSQLALELLLLEFCLDDIDLDSLVKLLGMTSRIVLARRELRREERVDDWTREARNRRKSEPSDSCSSTLSIFR